MVVLMVDLKAVLMVVERDESKVDLKVDLLAVW